jgi:phage I-like protein
MGFLRTEIVQQKWFENQVESKKIIKDNNISENALIYEMHFDKKVFKLESEVIEYLANKYLSHDNIEESETHFIAKTLNYSQVDLSTAVEIELRRGITAHAADLIRFSREYNFSDKENMLIATGCKLSTIDFSDDKKDLPQVIEVARVVEGEHPTYGKISITKEHLKSFVANFNDKVTGTDLAVNEDHKKNEAFGWFKDLFLNEEGDICYGTVNWNAKGTRALSEKEYRYFSPEFRFNYTHPHTKKEFGATLIGGALTNYPFLKMDAITELSEKHKPTTKGNNVETIELSIHKKAIDERDVTILELSNKNKELTAKVEKSEKAAVHLKMFNEGKINKAQLVALDDGKSMLEVIALGGASMNTSEAGNGKANSHEVELSEGDKISMKKFGLTEEEYRTANKIS